MNSENKCPVAEMEKPICETEYTIASDGSLVETEEIKKNPETYQVNVS